jgi:hypothetical protein
MNKNTYGRRRTKIMARGFLKNESSYASIDYQTHSKIMRGSFTVMLTGVLDTLLNCE